MYEYLIRHITRLRHNNIADISHWIAKCMKDINCHTGSLHMVCILWSVLSSPALVGSRLYTIVYETFMHSVCMVDMCAALPWWAWDCIRRGVDPSRASGRCSGSSNSWLRPGRYWCWRIPSSSEPFIPLLTPILMLILNLKLIIQQKLIKTFNLQWTSTFPAIDADAFYAITPFNSLTTWAFCSWMLPSWIIHFRFRKHQTKMKQTRGVNFIVKPFQE